MKFLERPNIELLYKGARVTINLDKKDNVQIVNLFSNLKIGDEYDIVIKKRGKRSLNANNYHWMLCEQIAKVLQASKYEVHNQLMIDYGTDWLDDTGSPVYVLMKDNDKYLRKETEHYRPTDAVEDRKGTMYRWFVLLMPSHLMDSKQMSELIDGTVSEAQELGIDTRTPDEIERMKSLWNGIESN
jgi:hypothetical protein